MKNKFLYLTKVSFFKKVKNKTFIIVNLVLLILIISLLNINSIVESFGGSFNETTTIFVNDKTNKSYTLFKSVISNNENIKIKKVSNSKKSILKNNNQLLLEIESSVSNIIKTKLISYDYIDNVLYTNILNSLKEVKKDLRLKELNINKEELDFLDKDVSIERVYIKSNKDNNEEKNNMLMNIIFPLLTFPFFTLTILVIQLIGAEINEEKSTKSMEYIISNVSPKAHFFSKILSVNLFAIMQSILIIIYSLIALLFSKEKVSTVVISDYSFLINSNINTIILVTFIMLFLTIIGYSLISGILASITTNMEDFQQLQTPIIIISLVGFYLSIISNMFEGSIFIKIISYIPFLSAVLAPCLFISGVTRVKDIIISILLMILTLYLLIKYGLKIYKEGLLNYSSNNLLKKMIKSLKNN